MAKKCYCAKYAGKGSKKHCAKKHPKGCRAKGKK